MSGQSPSGKGTGGLALERKGIQGGGLATQVERGGRGQNSQVGRGRREGPGDFNKNRAFKGKRVKKENALEAPEKKDMKPKKKPCLTPGTKVIKMVNLSSGKCTNRGSQISVGKKGVKQGGVCCGGGGGGLGFLGVCVGGQYDSACDWISVRDTDDKKKTPKKKKKKTNHKKTPQTKKKKTNGGRNG